MITSGAETIGVSIVRAAFTVRGVFPRTSSAVEKELGSGEEVEWKVTGLSKLCRRMVVDARM